MVEDFHPLTGLWRVLRANSGRTRPSLDLCPADGRLLPPQQGRPTGQVQRQQSSTPPPEKTSTKSAGDHQTSRPASLFAMKILVHQRGLNLCEAADANIE